jgi:hypothetical protein
MTAVPLPSRPLLVGVVAATALLGLLGAGLLAVGGGPLAGGGGEGTPPATATPVPTADTPAVPGLARVPGIDATGITGHEDGVGDVAGFDSEVVLFAVVGVLLA